MAVPPGQDEVSRIGEAMADLVAHLQREKSALVQLNAELTGISVLELYRCAEAVEEGARIVAANARAIREVCGLD